MIIRIIKILLLLNFLTIHAYAEVADKKVQLFNNEYQKVNAKIKMANPDKKTLNQLIKDNNQDFLKKIERLVSKKEFDKIKKSHNLLISKGRTEIHKAYIAKLEATPKKKMSDKNQQLLIGLIKSSEKHLYKGVKFASLTNTINITQNANATSTKEPITKKTVSSSSSNLKTDLQMKKQDENIELKKIQKESLHYSQLKKNQYKSDDDDSLFGKVSKAYVRNLGKVIDDDEKDQ